MKLVQMLASIVTGFAMLATVGSGSASALEFNLFGRFAPADAFGTTGVANGSFNGTFSYSGGAVPTNGINYLSSFSINILNASNMVVDTFNSNSNVGIIFGNPINSGSDILNFNFYEKGTYLQLAFPKGFEGTGNLTKNNHYASYFGGFEAGIGGFDAGLPVIYVASASSTPIPQAVPEPLTIARSTSVPQAVPEPLTIARSTSVPQTVPEPSTIAGTVLGSVGLMAARFKYKKQRAF
ncbi:MAG: PEP-CTERM sorting domain-containing protein [Nostoc sp. NMS7]|uniref:PEP-CTERM sorting domain-containing protein n=1 Tax=Nostoc sp. NMS7 TaxID=2815391 RepID=UPI0025DF1D91|nr:PEP-CTERM sorting domain-containing protein [Nostoc sp. NMS7]MBN3945055.1 PEP-CTERM sorting domain-containing protein [Nostoc sp. NMS7]